MNNNSNDNENLKFNIQELNDNKAESVEDENVENEIYKNFLKVLKDFLNNLLEVFPEYEKSLFLESNKDNLQIKSLENIYNNNETIKDIENIYNYVKTTYPERFFDLLYENENIFSDENMNTFFLPNIDFSLIWKEDISDKTKSTIWQYLKLLCFSVINDSSSNNLFGNTSNLFEAMDSTILKEKLESTILEMSDMFDASNNLKDISNNLPNIEELHENINKLMKGKLGRLATEITEETIKDLGDLSGVNNVKDLFNNLFKNPSKLTNLVKKMGDSLDKKIKNGDINESELMEEALEMMENFKNMPGMDNMQEMFQKMGMPDLTKSNINLGAMKGKMKQNIKKQKAKERMLKKLQSKKNKPNINNNLNNSNKDLTQIEILQKKLEEAKKQTTMLENKLNKKKNSNNKNKRKNKRRRKKKKNKK